MRRSIPFILVALIALVASVPVSAQTDWQISADSVFVGNQRVLRVAATDTMTASQRVAIIYQRLTVLQGNYPNFDPQRIGIAGVDVALEGGSPLDGCPDRLAYSQYEEWHRQHPGAQMYLVIGYFRLLEEPAFVGESDIGTKCGYILRDNGKEFTYFEKVTYFIPIVTVLPQDAKLHGWGIYESNLALKWIAKLQKAFEALR